MNILSVSNLYNPFAVNRQKNKTSEAYNNRFSNVINGGDVVSFTARKYDSESIVNPTYHCAYCGCKVYTEQQIEAIAKEILSSKSDRLEGKVKSILEKLEGAKHSQEIALAKRLENEEEIAFFKNFLEISSKKTFLRGDAIFEQVYGVSREEACETLVKNMHPLQRTIDHVSPQNEEKDNNSSDVNLVEACYCCNHDLKKGVSFNEFYTMFPSVSNNMPKEKLQYALSQVLDSSQANVLQRLSAVNMLKLLERLFIQRTEAANYLDSIDFRIKGCKAGIANSVEACQLEIKEKEDEKAGLEVQLEKLNQDPEFVAMTKRLALSQKLETIREAISSLRERRTKSSNAINEIRNPKKNNKKQNDKMSPEEKTARIESLKTNIVALEQQISAQEEQELEVQIQIEDLDKEFPTIEMLQQRKSKIDQIYTAHIQLAQERKTLAEREQKKAGLEATISSLSEQIALMPESTTEFKIDDYSKEEKEKFDRYKELVDALTYIDDHQNGGAMKVLINQAARVQIASEIETLLVEKSVVDFNENQKRKNLETELEKTTKEKTDVEELIEKSNKQIAENERIVGSVTIEEALQQQKELSDSIKRINEKTNQIRIPQRIVTLNAEITLLQQTIKDLQQKQQKIDSEYNINAQA